MIDIWQAGRLRQRKAKMQELVGFFLVLALIYYCFRMGMIPLSWIDPDDGSIAIPSFIFICAFYLGCARRQAATGYTLLLAAGLTEIAGFSVALHQEAPPGFDASPVLLTFLGIFLGFVLGVAGVLLLWGKRSPDRSALEELEQKYPYYKGFIARYERDLEPYLMQLEATRSRMMNMKRWGYLIGIPAIWGIALISMGRGLDPNIPGMAILAATAGLIWTIENPIYLFKKGINSRILPEFYRFLDMSYRQGGSGSDWGRLGLFQEAGLLDGYNRSESELNFAVSGTHNDVQCHMIAGTWWQGSGRNASITFMGVFIELVFREPFPVEVKILQDSKLFNKIKGKELGLPRVNLVYEAFEKEFEVYSEDQIGTRALLTPDVLEKLLQLSYWPPPWGGTLEAAFMGNKLLISVFGDPDENFSVGALDMPFTDRARISRIAEHVIMIHTIIDVLGLHK